MNLDRELSYYFDSSMKRIENQFKSIAEQHLKKLIDGKNVPDIRHLYELYYEHNKFTKDIPGLLSGVSDFTAKIEEFLKHLEADIQQICGIVLEENEEIELSHVPELLTDATITKIENFWTQHIREFKSDVKKLERRAQIYCSPNRLSTLENHMQIFRQTMAKHHEDVFKKLERRKTKSIERIETALRELYDMIVEMHRIADLEYEHRWIYLTKRNENEELPNPYLMLKSPTRQLQAWKSKLKQIEEKYAIIKTKIERLDGLDSNSQRIFQMNRAMYEDYRITSDNYVTSIYNKWFNTVDKYVLEAVKILDGYVNTMWNLLEI